MNSLFARYFAAVIGFGFVAVWISVGVTAALLCLLGSGVFFVSSTFAQRRRADGFTNRFAERSQALKTASERDRRTRPARQLPARRTPSAARADAVYDAGSEEPLPVSGGYGW